MCVLIYYPLSPEINLTIFGLAIVYMGSIKSLDQYELIKDSEVEKPRGWLSNLLSSWRTVWLFPIISSMMLLSAYGIINSPIKVYVENVIMLFLGYTGTTQLASYIWVFLLKAGLESLDKPTPILQRIQGRFFSFWLTLLSFIALVISAFITLKYISTHYWVYNNILAISFSIYFLNQMIVTSFLNGVVYMVGMVMYDIFWVYGTDVMVTVAQQIELPIKLMFPSHPWS